MDESYANNSLQNVEAVHKIQHYINTHLTEHISLYQLAKAAGYSPYHTARIFKNLTGKAPFEYIRQLRLSKAAVLLLDEKVKVIDVALDFVFGSHEGVTRAFSKEFGVTPKSYSQNPKPIQLFMPYSIRDYYLLILISIIKPIKNGCEKLRFMGFCTHFLFRF